MKSKFLKFLPIVLSAAICGGVFAACGGTPEGPGGPGEPGADTSTALAADNKIYLVGDSTVCDYSAKRDNYYLPRWGYGEQLYNYVNCQKSQIRNLALSGRSSRDYLAEANYTTLKSSIKNGDYLIIGFGHNDEKQEDAARFTDPAGTHTEETTAKGFYSFKYILYQNYIKVAKEAGATPILCTPIVRYNESGSYTGNTIHVTENGDYAKAIKDLGEATQTTVIDLTTITKNIYTADNAGAKYFHACYTYEGEKPNETLGKSDGTHLNAYGAKRVAYELAQAIKSTNCTLKNNVKTNSTVPTKDADFAEAIRADYVNASYEAFDPAKATKLTTLQTTTPTDWYATAMGELGGDKVTPFKILYADNTFTVGNESGDKGKITSDVDGFAAAFIQIPSNKNFTASATVKVKSMAITKGPNQAAFGMMIRDDIYINKRVTTLSSNYIAAGAFGDGNSSIFSRESKSLNKVSGTSVTVAVDSVYNVSIKREGQKVTATFSDGVHDYSKEYMDIFFNAVDSDNMYLCLFANRSIVAEFTNVQFEVTGEFTQA